MQIEPSKARILADCIEGMAADAEDKGKDSFGILFISGRCPHDYSFTKCRFPSRRRRCRGMSERQEHRKRLNARIAYAAAIERWAKNQPSRIQFFAVRRWLKEMPRKEDFYAAD